MSALPWPKGCHVRGTSKTSSDSLARCCGCCCREGVQAGLLLVLQAALTLSMQQQSSKQRAAECKLLSKGVCSLRAACSQQLTPTAPGQTGRETPQPWEGACAYKELSHLYDAVKTYNPVFIHTASGFL